MIEQHTPTADDLGDIHRVVCAWQVDGLPIQLHPGDLGWACTSGVEAAAATVRTWSRDGQLLALGFLDSPEVMRMAIAPSADADEELAQRILADVETPCLEARFGAALRTALTADGWQPDEPWTPLVRDLAAPVESSGLRIELIGPDRAAERVALHVASFEKSTFTEEKWHAMTRGPAYTDARCLVGFDDHDTAVAAATVWSAGPGRPGLLEPLGAHRDHRGRGYGRAISVAAAATLRELGSSSALVCTPSSNVAAVAAYASAGFEQFTDVTDFRRPPR